MSIIRVFKNSLRRISKFYIIAAGLLLYWSFRLTIYYWNHRTFYILLGPENEVKYEIRDVYNKLFDLDFHFTINPLTCDGLEDLLVLIIISSGATNSDNRDAIRNTYGKSTDNIKILFLLGQTLDNNEAMKIKKEYLIFGDIIQGNFIDSFENMTYKHVMGLKWAAHHCPMAKYVFKVDDDLVVNTEGLRRYIVQQLSPYGATDLMVCRRHIRLREVVRDRTNRWYVSRKQFPDDLYPPYCVGAFILYSKDVVIKLLETSQKMPYFFIDDAFLTGIVAGKIGVRPTEIGALFLYKSLIDIKESEGKLPPFIIGPLELDSEGILENWQAMITA